MLRFKQFISEMAFADVDKVKEDEVMQSLAELGNKPILWRGQTAVKKRVAKITYYYQGVVHVTNDRENFRGNMTVLGEKDGPVTKVVQGLKLKSIPVFCSFDVKQAKFFGTLGAIVPIDDFRILWNDNIHDLATHWRDLEAEDKTPKSLAKVVADYKQATDISSPHDGEIILDCHEYFWITPSTFLQFAKQSKFNKFKEVTDIKTYKDLYDVYKTGKSYLEWRKKNNPYAENED